MFRSSKKTTRRSHNRQQCGYESLEKKEMMAGNVTMVFDIVTRNILLTGDGVANQVTIRQAPANGNIVVFGNPGTGTTINGLPALVIPGPAAGNVMVNLDAGDDSLMVRDLVFNNFTVNEVGMGKDIVSFSNVRAKGQVSINTLGGNDQVSLAGAFAKNVGIMTDDGEDVVRVSGRMGVVMNPFGVVDPEYVFGGMSGGGSILNINTGAGKDVVTLIDLAVDGRVGILTGDGNDIVRNKAVRVADRYDAFMGMGDDLFRVEDTLTPVMDIRLEDGNDTFTQVPGTLPVLRRANGGLGMDVANLNGGPLGVLLAIETINP